MYYHNQGYSRGGLDVTTSVNMFFKFLLLSPIFLLAGYVSIAMMKHMIFHGVPVMNTPTEEQIQRIKERDESIGEEVVPPVTPVIPEVTEVTPVVPEIVTSVAPVVLSAIRVEDSSRLESELNEVTDDYEARKMEKYCIDQWLPRYGYIAAARGGPCDQYR
jgi:hypothetical protein